MKFNKWTKRLCLWILFAISFACFYYSINLRTYTHLSKEGVKTQGQVRTLTPENHNTYTYTFSVANKEFAGIGQLDDKGLKIGDSVEIVYLPQSPNASTDDDLSEKIQREWTTLWLGIVIFPAFLIFALEIGAKFNKLHSFKQYHH